MARVTSHKSFPHIFCSQSTTYDNPLHMYYSKSHEVAAQLKLLADAPERIWQCLEDQRYLQAAQSFLLSRHLFSRLELSGAGSDVVKNLWHSVSSFKDTIMQVSTVWCVVGRLHCIPCLDLIGKGRQFCLCAYSLVW